MKITHPRQTLIRPDAPATPPKIEPELPNIVQWAGTSPEIPKLEMRIAPSASTPKMQQRVTKEIAAPDVPNTEKDAGPLNIASSPVVNPQPAMPVSAMSAAVAQHHARTNISSAAPEVSGSSGDANLRSVIALSAAPAPPAPKVSVPAGNLAARIAISPAGTQPGSPNGIGSAKTGESAGAGGNASGVSGGGGGTSSLPATVSVSGGAGHATASGGIGSNQMRSKLLKPANSLPDRPEPMNARKGPADVSALAPNEPPEKILSGKEVYTLNVNLPNLTSISGSWILNFAQLDEDTSPFNRPKGTLSGPVPTRKVDPKYPPDAMKENIEGEVVLYAIIRADGSVDSIQLVRKLDPRLDNFAMQALAQWKFRPAMREGAPVDIEAVVHIPFKYRAPEP